jgi:large subunit ribosomal protein L17
MFRNMLVSLIEHERIKTTLAKAKELRGWVDKIVTLGKKGSLHARRQAFALLRNEGIVKKLFDEIAPQLKDRQGGYTRIYKMGWRHGDAAPLSLIELVTFSPAKEEKKSPVRKAIERVSGKKKGKREEEKEEKGKVKAKRPKAEAKAKKETKPGKEKAPKEKKEKTKKKEESE